MGSVMCVRDSLIVERRHLFERFGLPIVRMLARAGQLHFAGFEFGSALKHKCNHHKSTLFCVAEILSLG